MNRQKQIDEFYVGMQQAVQDEDINAFEQFIQQRKILLDEMIQAGEIEELQEISRRDAELMLLMKEKQQTITDFLYRQSQTLKAMHKYDR